MRMIWTFVTPFHLRRPKTIPMKGGNVIERYAAIGPSKTNSPSQDSRNTRLKLSSFACSFASLLASSLEVART